MRPTLAASRGEAETLQSRGHDFVVRDCCCPGEVDDFVHLALSQGWTSLARLKLLALLTPTT